jgi:hypothetical protein
MRVVSCGALSVKETAMLEQLFREPTYGPVDHDSDERVPILRFAAGIDVSIPLSQVLLVFVGSAVGTVVTEALKALGSEIGKKVFKHFAKRTRNRDGSRKTGAPLFPMVVVYKPAKNITVHVILSKSVLVSPERIIAAVEKWIGNHRRRKPLELYAFFRRGRWIISDDYNSLIALEVIPLED